MTSREFCYWLQGYFEISCKDKPGMTEQQRVIIEKHLNMVFLHEIDQSYGDTKHQTALNIIHNGPTPDLNKPPGLRC